MRLRSAVLFSAYLLLCPNIGYANPTKIVLDIDETIRAQPRTKVSDDLARKLTRLNYQVIRLADLDAQAQSTFLQFIDGDTNNTEALKRHADFLLFGKTALQSGNALGSPVTPQAATLDINIIQLSDGLRLYQSATQATSSFSDEKQASETAFVIAVSKAFKSIKLSLQQTTEKQDAYSYRLRIHNQKGSAALEQIIQHLQQLPHVTGSTLKMKKISQVSLTSTVRLPQLIQQLNAPIGQYSLNIVELRGEVITVDVVDTKP